MSQRTCGTSGCAKPHRARGLCSSCYNRQYVPVERRYPKISMTCGHCGAPTVKHRTSRFAERFCSYACRDARRVREAIERKLPALFMGRVVRTKAPPRPSCPPSKVRAWVAGRCRHCTQPFLDMHPDARYCSPRCRKRFKRNERKDEVSNVTRLYVLERDGWRCQICRRGIPATVAVPHRKAGTVDHVVPRSYGGSHDPANLRAAHFICNTLRGNRGGGEQLVLIG